MATITSSSVFDKIRLFANGDGVWVIEEIKAYQGMTLVGTVQTLGLGEYPSTHASFIAAKNRITSGQATFEYAPLDGNTYAETILPTHHVWMKDLNPIRREIENEQGASAEDIGPLSVPVFTTAGSTGPAAYPPLFGSTNRTLTLWRNALIAAGYSLKPPSTIPANEEVWHCVAEIGYNSGTGNYISNYSDWDTDGIQWTTGGIGDDDADGGNWTSEPPDNLNTVVAIRRYDHYHARWIRLPFASSIVTAHNPDQFNFGTLQQFDRVWNNTALPIEIPASNLGGDAVQRIGINFRIYGFGDDGHWDLSWKRRRAQLRLNPTFLEPASQVEAEDRPQFIRERTIVATLYRNSAFEGNHVESDDDYDSIIVGGDIKGKIQGYFLETPRFRTAAAATASQVVIRSDTKPVGVAVNMLFHVASTGEQMIVTAVNIAEQTQAASGDNPAYTYYDITFSRGQRGTTAEAIPADTRIWGIYDHNAIVSFILTRKSGITSATQINTYKIPDRV